MSLVDLARQKHLIGLDGQPVTPESLAGKVVLVVNVASQCGLTPQYTGLVSLYREKKADGLLILGVPCNQFGAQEPGTAEEIASFCSLTYGVDFPLLEKQDVNGDTRSPLYKWLVGDGPDIGWNFTKFLVGRDGEVLERFKHRVAPEAPELRDSVQRALSA